MAPISKPTVGQPGWNTAVDAAIDKVNAHDANPLVAATVDTTGAAVDGVLAVGPDTASFRVRTPAQVRDAMGLDARYPQVSSARPGNRFAFLGDSITQGSWDNANRVQGVSPPLWAQLFSGGRIFIARNAGVAGNTTAQMLARFDTDVTPYAPSTVYLAAGTNDIALTGTTFAQWKTDMQAIVAKIRGIGAVPVMQTIPPNAGNHSNVALMNYWIRRYTASQGIALVDAYALLVDPATGNYLSQYLGDGTHPNNAGTRAVGQLISDSLATLLPAWTPPLVRENTETTQMFASNPLTITDTNADGVPDGWVAYGNTTGTSHALVTDSAVPGKLIQVTQTAAAGVRVVERSVSTGFSVGDVLAIAGILTCDGGVSADVKADFIGASASARPALFTGAITRGVFYQEVTVPAGTTSINFDLTVGAGTGVVALGQLTAVNLTAKGL